MFKQVKQTTIILNKEICKLEQLAYCHYPEEPTWYGKTCQNWIQFTCHEVKEMWSRFEGAVTAIS